MASHEPKPIGISAEQRNHELRAIISRTKIDRSFQYRTSELRREIITRLARECQAVIDFGRSSRGEFSLFRPSQVKTVDINQYEGYPDIVDDLCDLSVLKPECCDGIVCLAVLEHVYDPQCAVGNLHRLLRMGGLCFAYTPFLYQYHAPPSLVYQDYYRFTRDGLAYLFRDFRDVTLFPVRGRFSTALNLLPGWKYRVEALFGERINRVIDWLLRFKDDPHQVSGYYLLARK